MLNSIKDFSRSHQNGLFINSCFAHCQSERQDTWFSDNSPVIGNKVSLTLHLCYDSRILIHVQKNYMKLYMLALFFGHVCIYMLKYLYFPSDNTLRFKDTYVSNTNIIYALKLCRQLLQLLETGISTEQVLKPLIVPTLVIIHATIWFSDEPQFISFICVCLFPSVEGYAIQFQVTENNKRKGC